MGQIMFLHVKRDDPYENEWTNTSISKAVDQVTDKVDEIIQGKQLIVKDINMIVVNQNLITFKISLGGR